METSQQETMQEDEMLRPKNLFFAGVFGLALVAAAPTAFSADSTDPIKIITNNWTSQLVLSNVVRSEERRVGKECA